MLPKSVRGTHQHLRLESGPISTLNSFIVGKCTCGEELGTGPGEVSGIRLPPLSSNRTFSRLSSLYIPEEDNLFVNVKFEAGGWMCICASACGIKTFLTLTFYSKLEMPTFGLRAALEHNVILVSHLFLIGWTKF